MAYNSLNDMDGEEYAEQLEDGIMRLAELLKRSKGWVEDNLLVSQIIEELECWELGGKPENECLA
jgi:hypothetical protein